jgi:hypothetical protein
MALKHFMSLPVRNITYSETPGGHLKKRSGRQNCLGETKTGGVASSSPLPLKTGYRANDQASIGVMRAYSKSPGLIGLSSSGSAGVSTPRSSMGVSIGRPSSGGGCRACRSLRMGCSRQFIRLARNGGKLWCKTTMSSSSSWRICAGVNKGTPCSDKP